MDIPENIIKEVVDSIKSGELDDGKLSELGKYVVDSAPVGDVDLDFKAKALMENVRTAVHTKDIGGIHTFLLRSLNDSVFVLGTSRKGFSRKVVREPDEYNDIIPDGTIFERLMNRIEIKTRRMAFKSERRAAINALDNWTRLINTSLEFVDILDSVATRLAKTPSAENLGLDATLIFKDAVRVEPKTELGKTSRAEAQRELLAEHVA